MTSTLLVKNTTSYNANKIIVRNVLVKPNLRCDDVQLVRFQTFEVRKKTQF